MSGAEVHIQTTIAALATAPAPAGVGIVRVSGPAALDLLRKTFTKAKSALTHPGQLFYGRIRDPENGETLDLGMVVYYRSPKSFTGEDVLEYHIHGNPLLARRLLRVLYRLGAEPAQAGEFTQRAFLSGKIDLVQAEAVCDLISATSERAIDLAGDNLKGRLSEALTLLGEELRNVLAEIEASVDFPEEEISPESVQQILVRIREVLSQFQSLIDTFRYGMVIKEGYKVLLAGRPNVGKSSLLNALLGKERAIVSAHSGTTRDLIEEASEFDGFRFVFCDSAGMRETSDEVEQKGVELARERLHWADLVLFLIDGAENQEEFFRTEEAQILLEEVRAKSKNVWFVITKRDIQTSSAQNMGESLRPDDVVLELSSLTGEGLAELRAAFIEAVSATQGDNAEGSAIVTNERHRFALLRAIEYLEGGIENLEQGSPLEILSVDLRSALSALDEIIGVTETEDILGRIFSRFCIGK